jgi:hypothetical protein
MALLPHALRSIEGRLKSVSNEGHFTAGAEIVFRPYFPTHCSGVAETCHMSPYTQALRTQQVSFGSVSNEGHFTTVTEKLFVRIYPRIEVGWLIYVTWHYMCMHYKQCKIGWSRSVMKGTLLLRLKQFFVFLISPPIAVEWLKYVTLNSLCIRHVQYKFG